ncbi:MAG: ABC transporter substrate-binding protein, partial [Firmicutes bacterium]|nr:ABC transporter substrate-binding protein [Bacillota bacterium]
LDEIAEIGKTITEKKTVAFEISALPYIYSTGKGTFIDEMITLIGAENVYGDQESWIPVAEEDAVAADPDVILTSVNYLPDAVGEIMGRPGWEEVKAVKNGEVYYIDNASSSLPNQYVVKALLEMAKAVYPEYYGEVELDLAA